MTDQVTNLAEALSLKDPATMLRIGEVTEISTGAARKVRTDQTGTAWLARDEDAGLAVGDRVWMLKQGATFLVAGRLSGGPSEPIVKMKGTSETVTSNATAQDDDALFHDLEPGGYRIELFVHFSSASATSDMRSTWTFSGTHTFHARSCFGPGTGTTAVDGSAAGSVNRSSAHALGSSINYGTDAGLITGALHEDLTLTILTAGTLRWRWAQTTSNASGTTVDGSSRLCITPVRVI